MQSRPSLTLRKPSTVSPEAIAAFVEADEPAPVSPKPAPVPTPAQPALRAVPAAEPAPSARVDAPSFRRASRAIVERRTRSARRRTTVYFDLDVATQLAKVLADRDQDLSDAVNDVVRSWLEGIK
jgi:hypothetical protein